MKVKCLQREEQFGRTCAKFPSHGTGLEFWCDPCTDRAEARHKKTTKQEQVIKEQQKHELT